ncbi:MAG: hypothetical protein H7Y18_16515 [Clostridiaceae bacterium]|nr:hypothetical protein [Clostridiaceae bacterium]
MKEYGYWGFQFLEPPTDVYREMKYLAEDRICRIKCQMRLRQQQLHQQGPRVGFSAVDVKELKE